MSRKNSIVLAVLVGTFLYTFGTFGLNLSVYMSVSGTVASAFGSISSSGWVSSAANVNSTRSSAVRVGDPGNTSTNHSLLSPASSSDMHNANMTESKNDTAFALTDEWLSQCVQDLEKVAFQPFNVMRPHYALGDCIKICRKCICQSCKWGNQSNTMGTHYHHVACPKHKGDKNHSFKNGGNLDVVEQIIQKFDNYTGFRKPDPDAIVLHLRLGDVIEGNGDTVLKLLQKGGNPAHPGGYRNSIKGIYEYLENIGDHKKVIIVGGSHKSNRFQKSRIYAGCLKKGLQQAGKAVTMALDGGDADKDFYFLCHAKKLIVSAGGFSKIIGIMVQRFGGEVIGRTF